MTPSREELLQQYHLLNDDEVLAMWHRKTLTDFAQSVLSEEITRRGLILSTQTDTIVPDSEPEVLDAGPLVTLTTYFKAIEAHILRTRLEAEEIPAYVFDEHIITANWFLAPMMGGVRVQVPQAFLAQAKIILCEMERGVDAIDQEDENK